ncbi:Cupredoxin [Pseudoneurospora amorphoporcata]|uniref:Cupredoxin n=1 Tax=Pseudoneurospora amorphoporcata TaxID=241081 RepID=A0AAN6P143_9PEZI|nr:Cupredoxin [Pseudoneurospora amorphoporcata]
MPSLSNILLAATLALSSVVSAKTIPVKVGESGLTFDPENIKADVGDVLEFWFYAKNHSIVTSTAAKPCEPKTENGFFSGFFPVAQTGVASENVFRVTVNSTTPLWFYCSQGKHCQAGMVGAVNAKSTDDFDKFKTAAKSASSNVTPAGGVFGGSVAKASSSDSGSSSGGSSSTTLVAVPSGTASGTASGASSTATSTTSGSPVSGAGAVGVSFGVLVAALGFVLA